MVSELYCTRLRALGGIFYNLKTPILTRWKFVSFGCLKQSFSPTYRYSSCIIRWLYKSVKWKLQCLHEKYYQIRIFKHWTNAITDVVLISEVIVNCKINKNWIIHQLLITLQCLQFNTRSIKVEYNYQGRSWQCLVDTFLLALWYCEVGLYERRSRHFSKNSDEFMKRYHP